MVCWCCGMDKKVSEGKIRDGKFCRFDCYGNTK